MNHIADNLKKLESRIESACAESGRRRSEIKLVAVTKGVPPDRIRTAYAAGLRNFGENRVQEASRKIPQLNAEFGPSGRPWWHMIGHLQTNKVRQALRLFDIIESVDSLRLAQTMAEQLAASGRKMPILLEINSSGEPTKSGLEPAKFIETALQIDRLGCLDIQGVMTVGPLTDDSNKIEKAFELTRNLFVELKAILGDKIETISMGMSGDLESAIKHGSTELRIGTAIFGKQQQSQEMRVI